MQDNTMQPAQAADGRADYEPPALAKYEAPMMCNVGGYAYLTTGCGFNFFEWPAQHSNCGSW
ncbi:hypothetical protein [Amycolatopsis magusensis]|uniref:hypothetical protein n=1 Tax=Amycolatopsis magusensis TaxID=882444 RepID=UPI0024A98951|nr:hypothetical protein [Amycolatopsis magusensis]MDI5976099.1 hypothetical protein [Amycolatopsis magusensis]